VELRVGVHGSESLPRTPDSWLTLIPWIRRLETQPQNGTHPAKRNFETDIKDFTEFLKAADFNRFVVREEHQMNKSGTANQVITHPHGDEGWKQRGIVMSTGKSTSDILWYNSSTGESQIWFMDRQKLTSRATVLGEDGRPAFVGPPFSIVGLGDFNGDGQTGILWHNSSTGEIQIWFMDRQKLSGRATVLGEDGRPAFVGPPFSIVGVGDFDGDKKADILWHNSSTGEIQIWFMDRQKLTSRATVLGEDGRPAFIGPPFSIVGVDDFDGDKKADILWHNSSTGEIQIWFMDRQKLSGRATVLGEDGNPSFIGPPFSIVGVGDFDGDKKGDILWYNSSTGEIQIWFMDRQKLSSRATVLGEDGNPSFIGPPFSIVGAKVFAPHPTRPNPPTGLRVTDVADRKISVSWMDHSDDEDGFSIRFRGKRPEFDDHTGTKSVGRNQVSATLEGLRSGYEYTITVLAFNAAGKSPDSNAVQATTPARTISVSKDGTGSSTVFVVTGAGFTPNSLVIIQITDPAFHQVQFPETAGGDGKFVSPHSFPCVSGSEWTVTAFEADDSVGTFANAIVTTCP
jgi:fibronectin type III domain protein/VCBS repeat protein